MKELLKAYFIFNKRDRNGILSLMTLSVGLSVLPTFYPYLYPKEAQDFSMFHQETELLLPLFTRETTVATADFAVGGGANPIFNPYWELEEPMIFHNSKKGSKKKETASKYGSKKRTFKQNEIKPFVFNPNSLNIEKAVELGFSKKQAQVIMNYLGKGGKFYKKEDFKKLYVVDEAHYDLLEDFIEIPPSSKKNWKNSKKKPEFEKKEFVERGFEKKEFKKEAEPIVWNLKSFDPNQLDFEKAKELGFPEKIAKTIETYLGKGGKFYKKEDLLKIYGLEQTLFEKVESYIDIPKFEKPKVEDQFEKAVIPKKEIKVALNTASAEALQEVPGIGPFFAKIIIDYRDELGGFANKEQLLEIYKIDEEKLLEVEPYLFLEEEEIKKINLNETNYRGLLEHPYFDHKLANALVKYRERHGNFTSVAEIQKSYLINETLFLKIQPYLTVD